MAKLAWSQNSFDLLASGYSPEQIAEVRKVSVRTIRREIDSAIARRRLDAPERYVHLQVARLTKALRFADAALERGDLKAVRALVTGCRGDGSLSWVESISSPHGIRRPSPALAVPCGLAARGGSRERVAAGGASSDRRAPLKTCLHAGLRLPEEASGGNRQAE